MSSALEDNFDEMKDIPLDPLNILFKIAYLSFLEIGTTIHFKKYTIEICHPGPLDKMYHRLKHPMMNGFSFGFELEKDNLYKLEKTIQKGIEWYQSLGGFQKLPEMELIFQKTICGLEHFYEMYGRNPEINHFIVKLQEIIRKCFQSSSGHYSEIVFTRTPELSSLSSSSSGLLPVNDTFTLDTEKENEKVKKDELLKIIFSLWKLEDIQKVHRMIYSLEMETMTIDKSLVFITLETFLKEKEKGLYDFLGESSH
jgi:hypothetical protein